MAYDLSEKADADLMEIYRNSYLAHGRAQADRYYDGLIARMDLVAALPLIARERADLSPPVRIHPHGRHLIVYRTAEVGILVLRVLHQSMEIEGRL